GVIVTPAVDHARPDHTPHRDARRGTPFAARRQPGVGSGASMSLPEISRIPLNTMLADLDESLKGLLQSELARHGFELVQIVFDAPTKEWASTLSAPTLNLFLYDIRETREHRPGDWEERKDDEGRRFELRPPLRVDVAYAVTAWTRSVEDEHRMLS